MPLHLPRLGASKSPKEEEKFIATSNKRTSFSEPSGPRRSNTTITNASTSSSNSGSSQPASILRKTSTADSGSDYTQSSGSGSTFIKKRLSTLSIDREDTISSYQSDDDSTRSPTSTPGTSVSSLGQCPLPPSSASVRFPFFVLSLSNTSTLQFIALPLSMRTAVLDAINRAWKKGISKVGQVEYASELMKKHQDRGCDSGVWEVTLKGDCWVPSSADKVSSKRILINLMTEFAKEGYNLASSFRTSAKDSGKDTLIFLRGEPDPDPIFFCVAFHSSDRVWIIDAEADVGEALENGIKEWWTDGIRDARVRERHCREIRLKGTPWTSHNTTSLISARCIHLVIMKMITHHARGYDFVGSVDMTDKEEGEMPATFYRKAWGPSRAVWHLDGEKVQSPLE